MARFAIRHWTGILIAIVVIWWALFYLPTTPSFAVFQLKRAIDARDGETASRYINFPSVVQHAGYEMVQQRAADPLSQMIGKGAVDLFKRPMADALEAWAVREVNQGADEVQMPPAAVAGAVVLMRYDDGQAYTRFIDKKNRTWEIRMTRDPSGQWQVSEVKNIQQLLDKLKQEEQKRLNQP